MKLTTYTRKQIFSGLLTLSSFALVVSLMAQPQPTGSTRPVYSFTPSHQSLSSNVTDSASQKPPGSMKDQSDMLSTNKVEVSSQPSSNGSTDSKPTQFVDTKSTATPPPKPLMPRCNCPMTTNGTSDLSACPNDCTPPTPNPLPPPHCAPCGGFRKLNSAQVIACPMYCME